MPQVIDLLSSSPEPQAAKTKPKNFKNISTSKISTTTVSKPLINAPPEKEWYVIFSDDDTLPQIPPSKASRPSNNERTKTISSASDLLPPLSSDDDSFNLPAIKSLKASNYSKPAMFVNPVKRDRDFFYLSEDFDSTVNLDNSVNDIDQPAAKKARASTLASGVTITKSIGYQGSISAIRTSTKSAGYERSQPDMEFSTKRTPNVPKLKKSNTKDSKALELDPIIFTSSPDPYAEAARRKMEKRKVNLSEGRGYNLDVLPELSSDAELSDADSVPMLSEPRTKSSLTAFEKYEIDREKEKKVAKKAEKAKKDADGKDEKGRKASVKEADKEKKRIAMEDKVKEKERATALAKVNTLRTDKKVSAPEMIVDLPFSLESKLSSQTEAFLDKFQIEHTQWDSQLPVVKFRRKVDAVYNDELGQYEPVARHIKSEKHVIYVMSALEFVNLVTDKDEGSDFDLYILQLKAKFDGCKILILMQGYNIWIKKNQNVKNRQYTQAVRAGGPQQEEGPPTNQRRKKKEPEYVDEDLVEDALLRLQMQHGLLVHHTAVMQETAEQLTVFTQHISLIPYKTQKQPNGTTFCMESGQVKTGDGPADTYVKMLQEMVRITAAVAYSITAKYPTLRELVEGLQENGPLDLEDCRKSSNKNGAFTDQRVGPAISKRVYKVFTGRDPHSLDV